MANFEITELVFYLIENTSNGIRRKMMVKECLVIVLASLIIIGNVSTSVQEQAPGLDGKEGVYD